MTVIKSDPDPDTGRPWFDFDFDTSALEATFREANGLSNHPDAAANASVDHLPPNSKHAMSLNANKDTEVHVLAVALDGTLDFVPLSEQRAEYYAHLAWYDPTDGTLDKLEFEAL